ncbi:MAG: DUF4271 domain-containing protein [Bacteroidetes bacterium]|nr:DUF4271 domain-containing protein [Bacteroidota bacterium]
MLTIAQDSLAALDSTTQVIVIDTAAVQHADSVSAYTSSLTASTKPLYYDIEQEQRMPDNTFMFLLLVALLIVLTTLKLAFSNDFTDLFRSVASSNIASQIVRTSREDLSLSSFLMNGIFVVSMSIFTRFVLLHFYPYSALSDNFSIVKLIILFTFFFVGKFSLLRYIGNLFELRASVDEYLFNLSAIVRTIGIAMIPILFMLYASSEKYFLFIFIASLVILSAGVVMIVIRGLSTSYKVMYSSVYHFLIYICVGEILPVFLFIKLLTKTAI